LHVAYLERQGIYLYVSTAKHSLCHVTNNQEGSSHEAEIMMCIYV